MSFAFFVRIYFTAEGAEFRRDTFESFVDMKVRMSFRRRPIIIFILLFIVASMATIEFKSPFDGNNLVGFPLRFYEYLGGKRSPEPSTRNFFNYPNLLIDIATTGIVSVLIDNLLIRIKKKNAK